MPQHTVRLCPARRPALPAEAGRPWSKPTGVDLSPYAHWLAWRERVAARPAVQAAMKAEGLMP